MQQAPETFRLLLAQLHPTVGDLAGNADKALKAWERGKAEGADMVALPEMFLPGYQTQDLIQKPAFVRDCLAQIEKLAKECTDGPALGIGGPSWASGKAKPFNSYFILQNGTVHAQINKHRLPNDNVFDEKRLFEHGEMSGPYVVNGVRIGTPICEDAWHADVCETLAETGAEILLVPNGSPYYRNKHDVRMQHMVARVIETGLPLAYLNLVGGQDDQIFDGTSFVLGKSGALKALMPAFDEAYQLITFERHGDSWEPQETQRASLPTSLAADYRAMVQGLGDYMRKCGFSTAVLGLSGGIDSAIVATIAADALGPENVRCVMLPSEYTSQASLDDAQDVAKALGCPLDTLPISGPRSAVTQALAPLFEGTSPDLTEENIQSRLRGLLLMALSNKFGNMLLTTGNKSEVAVGYATIYGDMNGGYNPIKDLYKTRVFEMCRWRNENHAPWMKAPKGAVIPEQILTKPPSAELRPDQKDEDSLPPYDVLDAILTELIDHEASVSDVISMGFEEATVKRVQHLIYISEYKRYQSAPGPRLSPRAFWLDRRYPIAMRWRDQG